MQAPTNYILEISYTYVKDIECRHGLHSLQFMQLQEYSCTRDSRDGFGEEDLGAVYELVEWRETQLIKGDHEDCFHPVSVENKESY
jgi:4-hydroxyphenylpyruvate dioxygenase-like putative hemolysin